MPDQDTENARLVTMKPGRPGRAVFFMPGFGGSVGRLRDLAGLLETPLQIVGVEGRGSDGETRPDADIATMAAHNVARIVTIQWAGPYALVGHSFGGLVAIEMARLLLRAGETVDCLILLDSNYAPHFWPRAYYVRELRKSLGKRRRDFLATPWHGKRAYLQDMFARIGRRLRRPRLRAEQSFDATASHEIAFAWYEPRFYPAKIIFFRAGEMDYPADANALWRGRCAELETHTTPGGHLTMLDPPNVATLAAKISAALARSDGDQAPRAVEPIP